MFFLFAAAFADPDYAAIATTAYRAAQPRSAARIEVVPDVLLWPGGARVRLRPQIDGLVVDGASQVVAVSPEGGVRRITGPNMGSNTLGRGDLGLEEAIAIASHTRARLGAGELWPARATEVARLVDGRARHAWRVAVSTAAPPQTFDVWVDAVDRSVLAVTKTSQNIDGSVFANSPIEGEPVVVQLEDLTTTAQLTGTYSDAYSCAEWMISDALFAVNRCDQKTRHAFRVDGDFIFVPQPGATQDPFAEVMLYHHVSEVARFFDDRYALKTPRPLTTIANFPMANAFFGDFDGDGVGDLSFGFEGDTNFGYDADVVYHEFGHWVVGRISEIPSLSADELGLDWSGGSLNEGAADIFSMVLTRDPEVGGFAGLAFRDGPIRQLERDRHCPDDLRGEVHRDGEIIGSLGWNLIDSVGWEVTADLTYGAVGSWGSDVDWAKAGQSFLDAADDLLAVARIDPTTHTEIVALVEATGMPSCSRLVPVEGRTFDPYVVTAGLEGELYRLPGGQQFTVDVPVGSDALIIDITDFRGVEGLGWSVLVRRGQPVSHVPTELATFGLGFAVPVDYDWLIDGEGGSHRIVLGPNSDPPLEPGETFYIAVAGRDLGPIDLFDFTLGQLSFTAYTRSPPESSGGCSALPGTLGGGGLMFFLPLVLVFAGCKKSDGETDPPPDTSPPVSLVGEGEACESTAQCEAPLACASYGICAEDGGPGTTSFGNGCVATVQCQAGLVCAYDQTCSTVPGPGTGGAGETCSTIEDCQTGLACFEGACAGYAMPLWEGAECALDTPPYRVLFEIPRGPLSSADFYRLPFPNDIAALGGVDLTAHPSPGLDFPLAGDVPQGILDDYSAEFDGFGNSQAIFFRLSSMPDFDTIEVGNPGTGTVTIVDIDPASSDYGERHPMGWRVTSNQLYICDTWIALYPTTGRPLRSGGTYAALLTTGMLAEDGSSPIQDADFAAMLGGPPADGALQSAWDAYAPLRTWMADVGVANGDLAGGTVFSVQDTGNAGVRIRDAVRGAAAPSLGPVTLCGDSPGPYADASDPSRGCFGADPAFHEIQGSFSTPLFQAGSAPFKVAADGGGADWSSGQPAVQGSADLTWSFTIPTGVAPPAGWPVVIFAHDGDGNYRSAVTEGLAAELTTVDLQDGSPLGFAVLTLETWLTGARAGAIDPAWTDLDPAADLPSVLWQSPLNPVAARDNTTQSAADLFQAVRMLEVLDWQGAASPTGDAIVFDLDHIYFVGHGLGTRGGTLFAAHEPAVKAVVLAAGSAGWLENLVESTDPYALSAVMGPAVADGAMTRYHPLLNLAQGLVDRTEPANQARFVHLEGDRDVLYVYGVGDTEASDVSQYALARGLFTQQIVGPGVAALDRLDILDAPVVSNIGTNTAVTVVNQAADPHRMLFDDPRTQYQVRSFLGTALRDGVATVPVVP